MSISKFFESLGAPLNNIRWSWGSRRPKDGIVFLRAWNDELRTIDGAQWAMIANHNTGSTANLGYRERQAHIQQVKSGARCLLVMCDAKDPSTSPRAIRAFDARTLMEGRDIKNADGKTWIRVIGHQAVADIKLPRAQSN